MGNITAPAGSKTVRAKLSTKAVEGERTIVAVVSSSNYDRDYERVDVNTLRLPLKGGGHVVASDLTGTERIDIPMLINHSFDVEDVIGSVRKAYLNPKGELVVEFGVSSRAKAQDLLTLIEEEHLDNAFSITMNDYDYYDSTIIDAEIVEISLVFRGSNKEARLLQVKSLLKGDSMAEAKDELEAKKAADIKKLEKQLADLKGESTDEPKNEEVPAPLEDVQTVDEPKPTPTEQPQETPVEEPKVKEDKTKSATPAPKEKEAKMSENIATDEVKPKAAAPAQAPTQKSVDKDAIRKVFVEQFIAGHNQDKNAMAKANQKAMDLRGIKEKAITYANGDALYQDEVVSNDIKEAYTQYGNVGRLVNRVDILGATKWKYIVEADGNGYTPVGIQGTKDEDKPVWSSGTVNPHEHALVVAWYDRTARETPIAVYNQVIRYIAKQYAKLEDNMILKFAGGTFDGEVYESTGLVPALTAAAGRTVTVGGYSSEQLATGLGAAYGLVESDGVATIVANRKTWGKMAVAVDGEGRTVFNVVGNQVQAGALGLFNVEVSQVLADDEAVLGVFPDYDLVTRGPLEQLFSREATVGSFNLFTQDGSAVRSNIDISGAATRLNSFVLLDLSTGA